MSLFTEEDIIHTLKTYRNIAVVGISAKRYRPSYDVSLAMQENGYNIFPVNPKYEMVLNKHCYSNLFEINEPIEIVNIFRRSDMVMPIIEDAITVKAKAIWMQLGVINESAAQKAKEAGLIVIMDRCIKVEHVLHRNRLYK